MSLNNWSHHGRDWECCREGGRKGRRGEKGRIGNLERAWEASRKRWLRSPGQVPECCSAGEAVSVVFSKGDKTRTG